MDKINEPNSQKFRWNENISKCWIITNIDKTGIYYASPQRNDKFIPHLSKDWIPINGPSPSPNLMKNLLHENDESPLENENEIEFNNNNDDNNDDNHDNNNNNNNNNDLQKFVSIQKRRTQSAHLLAPDSIIRTVIKEEDHEHEQIVHSDHLSV